MLVKDLIRHLSTLDPEAEALVKIPSGVCRVETPIILPVLSVSQGSFPDKDCPSGAENWVEVRATDAWGLDGGVAQVV